MWSTWMFDVSSDDLYGIYACIDWSVINVMEGFIQNWKYTALVNKKNSWILHAGLRCPERCRRRWNSEDSQSRRQVDSSGGASSLVSFQQRRMSFSRPYLRRRMNRRKRGRSSKMEDKEKEEEDEEEVGEDVQYGGSGGGG